MRGGSPYEVDPLDIPMTRELRVEHGATGSSWIGLTVDEYHGIVKLTQRSDGPPPAEWSAGDEVVLMLSQAGALVAARCVLLERAASYIRIRLLKDAERLQRRQNVRVRVDLPGECIVAGASRAVRLLDLSAGGCAISSDAPLDPGTAAKIAFTAGPNEFALASTVVRCTPEGDRWKIALRFGRIPLAVDAALVRYIFAAQRRPA